MTNVFFTLPLALVSGVLLPLVSGQCLSVPQTAIVVKGAVATL